MGNERQVWVRRRSFRGIQMRLRRDRGLARSGVPALIEVVFRKRLGGGGIEVGSLAELLRCLPACWVAVVFSVGRRRGSKVDQAPAGIVTLDITEWATYGEFGRTKKNGTRYGAHPDELCCS